MLRSARAANRPKCQHKHSNPPRASANVLAQTRRCHGISSSSSPVVRWWLGRPIGRCRWQWPNTAESPAAAPALDLGAFWPAQVLLQDFRGTWVAQRGLGGGQNAWTVGVLQNLRVSQSVRLNWYYIYCSISIWVVWSPVTHVPGIRLHRPASPSSLSSSSGSPLPKTQV